MNKIKYIPEKYIGERYANFRIWHDEGSDRKDKNMAEKAIFLAYEKIDLLRLINPKKKLNFCIYSSLKGGRKMLLREIPANMMMVPYTDAIDSLIIFFLPNISGVAPENLTRHLVHEIAHCFIDEKTESKKVLGDNDKDMKIESWKSEGLAEVISYYALGRERELENKKFSELSDELLNENLDNLNSKVRSEAFEIATARVFLEVQKIGLNRYFDFLKS